MTQISVVIPYCMEWPSVVFTARAVYEELRDFDVEICVGDNWCKQVESQCQSPDRGHDHIGKDNKPVVSHLKSMAGVTPWLKYFRFDLGLSHWQTKNHIIENTTSPYIMFVDAHCIPARGSLSGAFKYYLEHEEELNGTLSCPLTYHILEEKKLIYKLVYDEAHGKCEYSFTSLPTDAPKPVFQVPTMSSCGLIISRQLFDVLGSFPQPYSYSGGEHFLFQSLAVLGKKMWIFNGPPLHHHGDKRGYSWDYSGYHTNRAISWYCMSDKWLDAYIKRIDGPGKNIIKERAMMLGEEHRKLIDSKKIMTIEEWYSKWQA